MPEDKEERKWNYTENDLKDITPVKVRDLMIKCFIEVHDSLIAKGLVFMKRDTDSDEVQKAVRGMIKEAFSESGGDFENPDRQSLEKVLRVLAKKADSWGTPAEVIKHNKGQILRLIGLLKGN